MNFIEVEAIISEGNEKCLINLDNIVLVENDGKSCDVLLVTGVALNITEDSYNAIKAHVTPLSINVKEDL